MKVTDKINQVHHLDFLHNNLPDKCANLIIADPPYYKVKGETAMLRIQRECKIEYIKPIKEAVTKFIDDDAKEVDIKDKIAKLNEDLKSISDDRKDIQF